jgi:hypothetical protein
MCRRRRLGLGERASKHFEFIFDEADAAQARPEGASVGDGTRREEIRDGRVESSALRVRRSDDGGDAFSDRPRIAPSHLANGTGDVDCLGGRDFEAVSTQRPHELVD